MLREHEKRTLKWLLPAWIVLITVGTVVWLVFFQHKNEAALPTTNEYTNEPEEVIEPIPEPVLYEYIEITGGCNPYFDSTCITTHTQPTSSSPVTFQLRKGTVLKINETIRTADETWYKIDFSDEWLRYPERAPIATYVHSSSTQLFLDEGIVEIDEHTPTTSTKYIIVDRSEQTLTAYESNSIFMHESISTGLSITPTPRGEFTIYKKTPSRYMQGPIPGISSKYYDLPGVPWNLYFTHQGAVVHGAYWHDQFGKQWSSGCVNLSPDTARTLYEWVDVGMKILVRD